jgi:transglutaminase-like putative cysteine protease
MISPARSRRSSRQGSPVSPDPQRPSLAVRALIFAGFAALGFWHVSRLQVPGLAAGDLIVPLVLAAVVAATIRRGGRVRAAGCLLWLGATAALVGRAWPSRAHPLATFGQAYSRVREGGGRFAAVTLPFDPVAEPGLHALLVGAFALWLLALALVWLMAARPLPAIVLGVLPVALASTEFPLARPGLRVALLVALLVCTLAAGRPVGPRSIAALALPLALIGLIGAGLPGLARASFLDWRAWGRAAADSNSAAGDVRFAWDQTYDGLHFTGEPVVVLRVRSPRPSYWRVTVLDSFDGLRFEERTPGATTARAGARADVAPRPPGAVSTIQIETEALDEPYLVGAGNPVSFQVPESSGGGTLDANGVLRVLRAPANGTSYRVSAVLADPSRGELRRPSPRATPTDDGLDATAFAGEAPLPPFGDPQHDAAIATALAERPAWRAAYAWARQATEGATTSFDVALMLEQKLRSSHPYDGSSTLPQGDPDALAHWITSGSAGYCQMFSASMTELLRLLGVRARIAEGFVTGRYDPASRSYVVDDRDAHAWVEAWLPGHGFVPFDPTPGRSLPTQASSSSSIAPATVVTPSSTTPSHPATSRARPRAGTSAGSIARRATRLAGGRGLWRDAGVAGALGLLLAACLLAILRGGAWRSHARGPRAEVGTSRARLASRARRRGLELTPGVTNGELADALAARLEIDARAWARAADCAAYAPADQAAEVLPALRSETRRVGKAIRSSRRVTLPL